MRRLLFLVFLFAGCKKESAPPAPLSPTVLDQVTNTPIPGAAVRVSRGSTVLFTSQTDEKGTFQIPAADFNDSTVVMNVTSEKYWENTFSKTKVLKLIPEGWLQVRVHKVGTYPPYSWLNLEASTNQDQNMTTMRTFMAPTDSLVTIRVMGGQLHKLDWEVTDANYQSFDSGTINNLQIRRFDTLKNITVDY